MNSQEPWLLRQFLFCLHELLHDSFPHSLARQTVKKLKTAQIRLIQFAVPLLQAGFSRPLKSRFFL